MSKRVLFNGAVLVRPGAATKIDASQFENISLAGIGIVGIIGSADRGEPRVAKIFRSAPAVKAEYVSGNLVEAAAILQDPGNDPRIPAGAQIIVAYKVNNSTRATLVHDGKVTFTSKQYGVDMNLITVALADSSGNRILTVEDIDPLTGDVISEVSPVLGAVGKLTINYDPGTGSGSAATATITATALTTTVTGETTDNLNLLFASYPTLAKLIAAINNKVGATGGGVYTAAALVTNAGEFDVTNLDTVAAVNIFDAVTGTFYSKNYDIVTWINENSSIISATLTKGQAGPPAVLAETALAGGTLGSSDNTAWVNGFNTLGGLRINHVVPLASVDGVSPDTYTIDSIITAAVAHAKFYSSTAGRSERQIYAGQTATKTNLIAQANAQNSEHLCYCGQTITRLSAVTGNIVVLPAWGAACIAAGMRAGAPLGEPLTWKLINALGIGSDSSWDQSDNDDVEELTLNGVFVINEVRGVGFRIDKMITTYTKSDNDAFTEETIVQIWKAVAYELRTALENAFVGRPGNLTTVQAVPGVVHGTLQLFADQGALTKNRDADGVETPAFDNIATTLSGDTMSVGVSITPTPGINFVLNTLAVLPANIQL